MPLDVVAAAVAVITVATAFTATIAALTTSASTNATSAMTIKIISIPLFFTLLAFRFPLRPKGPNAAAWAGLWVFFGRSLVDGKVVATLDVYFALAS